MYTLFGYRTHGRILVADWDRTYALTLAALIHQAGFSVATAFNGKEAVAKAQIFGPDLLLTEAYMGRLSGIQAAARITSSLPGCRVLFLCGEASAADIANAAPENFAYSFTPKPIGPLELIATITHLLSAESSTPDSACTGYGSAYFHSTRRNASPETRHVNEFAPVTINSVPGALLQQIPALPLRKPLLWYAGLKREHADRHIRQQNRIAPADRIPKVGSGTRRQERGVLAIPLPTVRTPPEMQYEF